MYRLDRQTLDLVVGMLDEDDYVILYMTGNKDIQRRIKKCPVRSPWWPLSPKYSENVVEVFETEITNVLSGGRVCFIDKTSRIRMEPRVAKIPPTMTRLGVNCYKQVWGTLAPLLENVTDLSLFIQESYINKSVPFAQFPANLQKLKLRVCNAEMIRFLPRNLVTLEINRVDYHLSENRADIRFLTNLEEFECCGWNIFTVPTSLRKINNIYCDLDGIFPNLTHANVRFIEGSYPAMKELRTTGGNLSGCNKSCEVSVVCGRIRDPCARYTYKEGHLTLHSDDMLELISCFPVTSITCELKNSKQTCRWDRIRELFPLWKDNMIYDGLVGNSGLSVEEIE